MSILLVTDDGADQLRVTRTQMTVCRLFLSLPDDELEAFRALLQMGPQRWRALVDVAESEIALEALTQKYATNQPLPPVVDGTVRLPIPCHTRRDAFARGDHLPVCTWRPDTDGFTCAQCGKWVGNETSRGELLGQCFAAAQSDPCLGDGQ